MKSARTALFIAFSCLLAAPVLAQTTGETCSLGNSTYTLSLSGRAISAAGSFAGSYQGIGTVTITASGAITMTGTYNTNLVTGKSFTYSGTYTVASNCTGTVTLTSGSTATFTTVIWSSGQQFNITGSDATYIYAGNGTNVVPAACAASTLSGPYTYSSSGFTQSGTAQTGSADESGVLQFDGQGNVTATYTQTSGGTTAVPLTSTGTYSVTSGCLGSATLMDSKGNSNALNFVIESPMAKTSCCSRPIRGSFATARRIRPRRTRRNPLPTSRATRSTTHPRGVSLCCLERVWPPARRKQPRCPCRTPFGPPR